MTPTVVAGDPAVLTSGDTCLTLCDSGSGIVAGPMTRRGAVAPVVRARALHGVPALVTRHGGDATAYFARFGLPLVPAEDMTVPVADMNLLLDTAAAELGCAAFGLLLAEAEDETILGPLAVALSACATVAEAADCASRFLHVHCPAMTTTVRPDPTEPGTVVLGYDIIVPGAPYPTQAMELGVAMTHRILVALVGEEYGLRAVDLSHGPQSEPERDGLPLQAPPAASRVGARAGARDDRRGPRGHVGDSHPRRTAAQRPPPHPATAARRGGDDVRADPRHRPAQHGPQAAQRLRPAAGRGRLARRARRPGDAHPGGAPLVR